MEEEVYQLPDTALVAGAKEGNEACFEAIYRRYVQMVFSVGYRMTGTPEDAEDVTQEVFLRVARSIRQFREEAKLKSWIYKIALNVSSDLRKRSCRQQRVSRDYVDGIKRNSSVNESSREILESLDVLRETERQALVLTLYEGLTHAEAAKVLSCAEKTVSWRLFSARRKLRQYYKFGNET